MSNADLRHTEQDAREARALRLTAARELIEEAQATPEGARISELVARIYLKLGGSEIESSIASLTTIVKSGDLSRELEFHYQLRNLERVKRGEDPIDMPRVSVSAATHRGAVRDREKLRDKRDLLIEEAEMQAAEELARPNSAAQRPATMAHSEAKPAPSPRKEVRKDAAVLPAARAAA